MIIISITSVPTDRETQTFRQRFAEPPWSEDISENEAREYLERFRQAGSGVLIASEREGVDPYLYLHFRRYDSVADLVAEEFTGEHAFYTAADPGVIGAALTGQEPICFISNIHADRQAPVDPKDKPRLKILPEAIGRCLAATDTRTAAYFTHKETRVYDQSRPERLPGYRVAEVVYNVTPSGGSRIKSLVLFVVGLTHSGA